MSCITSSDYHNEDVDGALDEEEESPPRKRPCEHDEDSPQHPSKKQCVDTDGSPDSVSDPADAFVSPSGREALEPHEVNPSEGVHDIDDEDYYEFAKEFIVDSTPMVDDDIDYFSDYEFARNRRRYGFSKHEMRYFVWVDADTCDDSMCIDLLKKAGCEHGFLRRSRKIGNLFWVKLKKDAAAKLAAVDGIAEIDPESEHFCSEAF